MNQFELVNDPYEDDIRLVKFENQHPLDQDQPLRFSTRTVALRSRTVAYHDFLANQLEAYSDSETYANWITKQQQAHADQETQTQLSEEFISNIVPRYEWGDFIAVSYTWGDRRRTRDVVIDDNVCSISENLENALRASFELIHIQQNLYIWNDFMCIDQSNEDEINKGLKGFSNIFGKAAYVTIWVGGSANESDHVLRFARHAHLHREKEKGLADSLTTNSLPRLDSEELLITFLSSIESSWWSALARFLSRPYWGRLWIIQELALANQSSLLMCGTDYIPLTHIWSLVRLINRQAESLQQYLHACESEGWSIEEIGNAQTTLARIRYIADLSHNIRNLVPCDLGRLFKLVRPSKSEIVQDKIYGVLGLVEPEIVSAIVVDRDKSPNQVFADFTQAYIQHNRTLDIFQHCNLLDETRSPSWAPDLLDTHISPSSLCNGLLFNAGGTYYADFEFGPDSTLTINHCFLVDQIATISPSSNKISTTPSSTPPPYPATYHRYGTFSGLQDALWRTLVANRSYRAFSQSVSPYRTLLQIPWTQPLASITSSSTSTPPLHGLRAWTQQLDAFRFSTSNFDVFGHPLCTFFAESLTANSEAEAETQRDALLQMSRTVERRRLVTTARGRLGVVPEVSKPGDEIVVIPGCSEPVVLRRLDTRRDECDCFLVVGTAYVHGFMKGEVLRRKSDVPQTIVLC